MKSKEKNAVEVYNRGGAVMASEWISGRGRHVSKRPVPDLCAEIGAEAARSLGGLAGKAARRILRRHPKAQKLIVVKDVRAVARLAREADKKIKAKVDKSKADEKARSEARIAEARRVLADADCGAILSAWALNPHHPAPPEVVAAKQASGLTWGQIKAAQ